MVISLLCASVHACNFYTLWKSDMSLTAAEGLGVARESDRNWAMLQEEATSKDNNSTPQHNKPPHTVLCNGTKTSQGFFFVSPLLLFPCSTVWALTGFPLIFTIKKKNNSYSSSLGRTERVDGEDNFFLHPEQSMYNNSPTSAIRMGNLGESN